MKDLTGVLNIKRIGNQAEINIEGVIGVPEWWQFEDDNEAISTKEKMKDQIKQIEALDNIESIIVNIDSPGGSVNHGKAIYTALKNTKATIFVNYTNDSASAATIIGAAAKKENVSIPDYVTLLVHEAWISSPSGTKSELKRSVETLEKMNLNIATIYSGQNNLTIEENLALIGKDNGEGELLSADKALELGFVGNIQRTEKMAAFNPEGYKELYTNKQLNKLNNFKMGLFNKEKKAPLQVVNVNDKTFAHRGLEVGNSFEIVGSDDLVNGDFEIDGTTFKVEDSKITALKEKEVEVINYEKEIAELKETIKAKDSEILELKEHAESHAERIEVLEESIALIRGESSKNKPPQSVFEQHDQQIKKSAAEQARERQREKVANSKNGGTN